MITSWIADAHVAGTGGKTLKDLGYGFLGQYRRHVKDRVSTLLELSGHICVADRSNHS